MSISRPGLLDRSKYNAAAGSTLAACCKEVNDDWPHLAVATSLAKIFEKPQHYTKTSAFSAFT